jgi:hypothetical protein
LARYFVKPLKSINALTCASTEIDGVADFGYELGVV